MGSEESSLDRIFEMLARMGLEAVKTENPEPVVFVIPEVEVRYLAEIEHHRWFTERGLIRDPNTRASPYLLPWLDLPEEIREKSCAGIRSIPEVLAAHGYEVRRRK